MIAGARKLMKLYQTLAPVRCGHVLLSTAGTPRLGDHIVAGESNAVTFYNSVIGARTNKYGDYLDVACALIGQAPFAGLHIDGERKAQILFRTGNIPEDWREEDIFFHLLGLLIGRIAGRRVPVIEACHSVRARTISRR